MEFEEKRMQLELEKLRLEQKTNCSTGEGEKANQAGSAHVVFGGARYPDFPLLLIIEKMIWIIICYGLRDMILWQTGPKLIGN